MVVIAVKGAISTESFGVIIIEILNLFRPNKKYFWIKPFNLDEEYD